MAESSRYCIFCDTTLPISAFPSRIAEGCEHGNPNTCRNCIIRIITHVLSESDSDDEESEDGGLDCPECGEPLTHDDILCFGTCEQAARYEARFFSVLDEDDVWADATSSLVGSRSGSLPDVINERILEDFISMLELEEAQTPDPATPGPDVECVVCLESKPSTDFPSKITDTCAHTTVKTCAGCVEQLLSNAVDGAEWIDPECPECKETLSPPDVQRLGTRAQAECYNERLMKRALQDLVEFRECIKCGVGQFHEGGHEEPIVTCAGCGDKTCFSHNMPWHTGLTCVQYDESKEREEEAKAEDAKNMQVSEELVRSISKACPGPECGYYIQKSEGCDHMTCKKCKFEFCYVCCAAYDTIRVEGNKSHKEDCCYYA